MIYLFFLFLFIGGEFYLKNRAEKDLSGKENRLLLRGKVRLRLYHNRGAFLNLLEKRRKALLALSCFLTLGIACLFLLTLFQKGNGLLKLSLTLLLGGAFSNTYDRLKRKYVVDYFSFTTPFTALNKIVFNLSDFAILVGSLLLVLSRS